MGTEQCPANMCEHTVEDHYTTGPVHQTSDGEWWPNQIRCRADDCKCGIFEIDEETWNWLTRDD